MIRKDRNSRASRTAAATLILALASAPAAAQAPGNDDCSSALAIGVGTLAGQSWSQANNSGETSCECGLVPGISQPGASVFYSYTAPATGLLTVDGIGSFANHGSTPAISIHSGCPADTGTELACSDGTNATPGSTDPMASLLVENGQTVVIAVRDVCVPTSTGEFDLTLAFDASITEPSNDDCASALSLTGGFYPGESFLGADSSGFSNCGCFVPSTGASVGASMWYRFQAPTDGTLTVHTGGSFAQYGTDTSIGLTASCPGSAATELVCNADFLGTNQDAFVLHGMLAGETVRIQVRAQCVSASTGLFDLTVNFAVPPEVFPQSCTGDGSDALGCTPCPCDNDAPLGTVGGCLNSAGTSARLLAIGETSLTAVEATDLTIELTGATPSSFAVLVSGDSIAPQNPQNPCFGTDSGLQSSFLDGLRCAVQGRVRHGGRAVDAIGDVGFTNEGWGGPHRPQPGIGVQGGFAPGQTRHFQAYYRELPDLVCMTGQNTTQAISITFEP